MMLVIEQPTLYYEQNVFCVEPLQMAGKFKMAINGVPSQKSLSSPITKSHPSNQHSLKCQERYIRNAAGDLHFSKEVIKDRGLASLSYQEWDSKDVYNALSVFPQKEMRSIKIQQKGQKSEPKLQRVSHAETFVCSKNLKAKSCIGFRNGLWRTSEEMEYRHGSSSHLTVGKLKSKTFLTDEATLLTRRISVPYKGRLLSLSHGMYENPREVLLKKLTKPTAQRIVSQHIESKGAKQRPSKHYGLSNSTELSNNEHMTEEDFTTFKKVEKYNPEDPKDVTDEHKPETPLPVFLKIPGYLSPRKQVQEVGGENKTVKSLAVKHFELPPPLRLQNLMNLKAGKYIYATENDFERELYSLDIDQPLRPEKGAHGWVALPTVAAEKTKGDPQNKTSANVLSDRDKDPKKIRPLNKKQVLQNIVTQWRNAWLLSACWKDATLEQLTRDLGNVHNSHKISALITIASSAVDASQEIAFPADILNLVSNALQEDDNLVRIAAALCQYLIQQVSEDAKKILFKSLEEGTDADSWAAAQCLALEGNHNYLVIKRILEQMFAATNKETEEQALYILHDLSKHTVKPDPCHAGEALNSGNWGERIMACNALTLLHGNINQGVKNKLSYLMWNDWSPIVRGAAAKTLGKLGQGKEVHDQIRNHLEGDSWKEKVEALSVIGFLQIMTADLLPGFLQCFDNDFLAVRRQACQTAGLLQSKDEMVMNCLYQLVQNDPVWKVKAHAIKALGKIGHITPDLKELMLSAVRVKEPGVRIEAYRCIATLNLCDYEVQHALQDRLILESHEFASRELKQTLTALNMAHNGNQEMMSRVKQQLSKLCQKEVLFPKVLVMDKDLASKQIELEKALLHKPNWKHKMQEQRFSCDSVDKT